ncbi:hypothetical protein F0562_003904 [Nyssa sinensis]|uniref:RPW8 domain-containing protein n=1 Tax=Nyssa sinensis TaxID=561372 RepID=A0A5J5C006_9ASTE|nr:hypothetical protein F0562_003904 [Nyssa sinensis]
MAVSFIGSAALGAAFTELAKAVEDVKDKAVKFKSILKRLASTLKSIEPVFAEIERLNRVLDRPEEETEMFTDRLIDAKKLVRQCSKIRWWNYCMKPFYAKKLIELEDSLVKFFQIDVQARLSIDSRNILARVNEINVKLDRSLFLGSCGVPDVPDHIVGLDLPHKELKLQLLKDDVSVVVISAPEGYGKTTLAKMFCHDDEIQGIFRDNIFFVTILKTPKLELLVKKLFRHEGYPLPEIQNDDDAINQLEYLQKQIGPNPVLLILDDAWPESESLIQNFMFPIPGYKILVTSRFEFPGFDSTFKLQLLNDDDATDLFCHWAFTQGGSSCVPDDLVNEIVRGCGGFPLALTLVGQSLRGQPEVIWRRTLKEWAEGKSILYPNGDPRCRNMNTEAMV